MSSFWKLFCDRYDIVKSEVLNESACEPKYDRAANAAQIEL